jgi:hypothetical protein
MAIAGWALLSHFSGQKNAGQKQNADNNASNSQIGDQNTPTNPYNEQLNKIEVSGKTGDEPVVKVPKDLQVNDEDKSFLRDGEGEVIKPDDLVYFRVQKVALGDEDKMYSTWKMDAKYENSVELGEDFEQQTEPWLRAAFPGKKVGASFAIVETTSRKSLEETQNLSEEQLAQLDEDPNLKGEVKQIWIITITRREDGTKLPVHPKDFQKPSENQAPSEPEPVQ